MAQTGKTSGRRNNLTPGMIVTVAVALIGCCAVVAAALGAGGLGYLAFLRSIDDSANGQRDTSSNPVVQGPTDDPAASKQSTQEQEEEEMDWQRTLSVDRDSLCFSVYTPESLFQGEDKVTWLENNIWPIYEEETLPYAPVLDYDPSNMVIIYFIISHSGYYSDWLQLSKNISVDVEFKGDPPQVVDTLKMSGCGGEGQYRLFDTTPLDTGSANYNVEIEAYEESTDFKIEPGQFEVFVLSFECKEPGVYSIALDLPVSYQGDTGHYYYTSTPEIVCPDQANYNIADTGNNWPDSITIFQIDRYEWTGSQYERINP